MKRSNNIGNNCGANLEGVEVSVVKKKPKAGGGTQIKKIDDSNNRPRNIELLFCNGSARDFLVRFVLTCYHYYNCWFYCCFLLLLVVVSSLLIREPPNADGIENKPTEILCNVVCALQRSAYISYSYTHTRNSSSYNSCVCFRQDSIFFALSARVRRMETVTSTNRAKEKKKKRNK